MKPSTQEGRQDSQQGNRSLESRMTSKESRPVWREADAKVLQPQQLGSSPPDSITDDGSTHPLAERLKPEPSGTQDKVAVLSILAGRMGTNEVS
jgi:hypothetical protein